MMTVRKGLRILEASLFLAVLWGASGPLGLPAASPEAGGPIEEAAGRGLAGAQADEGKKAPPGEAENKPALPPGVIARLNGRDITLDEYSSYLLASVGKSKLDEYVDRLLVEEEARRQEITVAPAEVEAAVEAYIDRTVKGVYQGKQEAYLANLARRRTTLEEDKARLRQERYYDTLWEQVILKTRQVTEEDIQRQFERTYGEGGVQNTLRHILISTQISPARGQGGRSKQEARDLAEKVLKELQAGADFVQAVKQYSDDEFTKRNDGRIPQYRKGFYGDGFHRAVLELNPERPLSGVVESPRGYHLIKLVDRQVTKLEDVKAEVEKAVKSQSPTPRERHDLIQRLRQAAKIEGL